MEDEEGIGEIDFTWFYIVGVKNLNLSYKQVGRLTLRLFNKLHQQYKNLFDLEMHLYKSGTSYAQLKAKAQQNQFWF